MDTTNNRFGAALDEYRLAREWTLGRVAEITGVSVGTISKIISGHTNPSALTRRRITNAIPHLGEIGETSAPGRNPLGG